ncbi:ATP-binding cassette domain-containing protein [Marinilactibacillus psychrotolerans]|uniref:ATP-binding cassette domain-containing protein n=2 Tax=Marinilactibacillus psychrotolerans TaxID=191770 RepID=A0A5R9C8L9_9LACT|nr:ATP-binding cassette domain-containing protein [Marinilactibacillus psychrotolerans]TLQ09672.1 ATP-binding cassette domain-containing protein [Marinilactibacillus psychrotolerans]GEQ33235.1 ABC transporter ATP-binding protein [Marinilactibacillus psychrotolerans]SJN30522.1 YbbL ABC transporter ATP-binding protein [Marinilactibacillus psychrotolerans 42ea]
MDTPIISLKQISFKIAQEMILEDITFDIQKGEVLTITGPSGSGKSTLLKLIGSLFSPTEGTIVYKGKELKQIDPEIYRKEVSYFFQNASLFDQTVKDNLVFPYFIRDKVADERYIKSYLEKVKIPESYYNKPVAELSGGEKQRVALVRNLLFQPEVLLLDEVTSSLDANNKAIIHSVLSDLNKEKQVTIVKITHDETELADSTRLLHIVNGRLEENDGK